MGQRDEDKQQTMDAGLLVLKAWDGDATFSHSHRLRASSWVKRRPSGAMKELLGYILMSRDLGSRSDGTDYRDRGR